MISIIAMTSKGRNENKIMLSYRFAWVPHATFDPSISFLPLK